MTTEGEHTRISREEVEAAAAKLETFMETLPEQERNVLGWILTRAQMASNDDVSGYTFMQVQPLAGFSSPFSSQLGRSAGFGNAFADAGGSEVSVVWKYKF